MRYPFLLPFFACALEYCWRYELVNLPKLRLPQFLLPRADRRKSLRALRFQILFAWRMFSKALSLQAFAFVRAVSLDRKASHRADISTLQLSSNVSTRKSRSRASSLVIVTKTFPDSVIREPSTCR